MVASGNHKLTRLYWTLFPKTFFDHIVNFE